MPALTNKFNNSLLGSYDGWAHAFLRAMFLLGKGGLPIEETVEWADALYKTDWQLVPEEVAQREFQALESSILDLMKLRTFYGKVHISTEFPYVDS